MLFKKYLLNSIRKNKIKVVASIIFICTTFVFGFDFNKKEDRMKYKNSFYAIEIPDDIFEFIKGKSYKSNCILNKEELRYLHVLHIGFDDKIHEGELICNKIIAEDLLEIFRILFNNRYQIEKICLVDNYDADDEKSMRDNNSSSFNFRFISHTNKISKHGLGIAIDINPLYNPYIKEVNGKIIIEPSIATDYVDREKEFPHKITQQDLCYKLFIEHGFEWGGEWSSCKDYQHFELP